MTATTKHLLSMTAADLMTASIVQFSEETSLREAAQRLVGERISGAPVVDAQGVCVGVLSSTDFVNLLVNRERHEVSAAMARPLSCSHQRPHRSPTGQRQTACTRAEGGCAVQKRQSMPDGSNVMICTQPYCVFADWQVFEMEELPADEVRHYMTADPVVVRPDDGIRKLAHCMIDGGVRRVIVVDELNRPIGIVSATDILAAICNAEDESTVASTESINS
ncbi:MAG: HPP family protein [Gemmataceae bacterium]